ncbi:hypothetical protein EYF80_060248 [Liparis tanakae]|uniref:Uncharacterized protein n=1 Tax=Liparis tanakae TaxID=230148 RepID=A0A4Z2EMK5_9TELE|nr:hypothetical protein EYF80_060248 [Liparis tanakae]
MKRLGGLIPERHHTGREDGRTGGREDGSLMDLRDGNAAEYPDEPELPEGATQEPTADEGKVSGDV